MKKTIILAGALVGSLLVGATAYAQDEMKALSLVHGHGSGEGSSRYQALGGAMGAVGSDYSSANQNPAGIALFRSGGKISLTGTGILQGSRGSWYGQTGASSSVNRFSLSELSYMSSWGSPRSGMTIGLSISSGGRFDREVEAAAIKDSRVGTSLADYAAAMLNRSGVPHAVMERGGDLFATQGIPWIGIMGWGAGWIEAADNNMYQTAFAYPNASGKYVNYAPTSAAFVSRETGGVTNIDFALGFRINPTVNLGLQVRGQSLSYNQYTSYKEGFKPNDQAELDYLGLDNWHNVSGMGIGFGFGVLTEPMSGLRLGASVYTPTFYNFKQDYSATATGYNELFRQDKANNKLPADAGEYKKESPDDAANTFAISTPWRFGLNAAYVFGRKGIVSADYEYIYTASTRLRSDDDYYSPRADFSEDNRALRRHFSGMHRLRLGLEYNLTPRIAARGGYRYESAVGRSKLFATPGFSEFVHGTQVHYRLPEGSNAFSLGAGFRLSPAWTLDVAYTHERSSARYVTVPTIEDPAIGGADTFLQGLESIKEGRVRNLLSATISVRF